MSVLEKLSIEAQQILSKEELRKLDGGTYCSDLYANRSCNWSNWSPSTQAGWAYGWGAGGCGTQGGATYWNQATSSGWNLTGCSTGWYSY
jgi:hypothetical protein